MQNQEENNYVIYAVLEMSFRERTYYSMNMKPTQFFDSNEKAREYAETMNKREESLLKLALKWYDKVINTTLDDDPEIKKMQVTKMYDDFVAENKITPDTREAIHRFLTNNMRSNQYVVADFDSNSLDNLMEMWGSMPERKVPHSLEDDMPMDDDDDDFEVVQGRCPEMR